MGVLSTSVLAGRVNTPNVQGGFFPKRGPHLNHQKLPPKDTQTQRYCRTKCFSGLWVVPKPKELRPTLTIVCPPNPRLVR